MKLIKINLGFVQKFSIFFFVVLSIWWTIVALVLKNNYIHANLIWAASYQLMAVFGLIFGFIIARSWGGIRSIVGKTIMFFSIGLLLQVFGQTIFSIYNLVLEIEIPYPSWADVGYFLSIPFYVYATILLGKVSGVGLSLKSVHKKILAIFVPLALLLTSYMIFLQGYEFDWSSPLRIFLDFGYPLGQAFYVSLALLVFVLSKEFLGGVMRSGVLTILLALVIQYVADYNFLYQVSKGTWINGGYGDFIYLSAYFFMSIALINLGNLFKKIKET